MDIHAIKEYAHYLQTSTDMTPRRFHYVAYLTLAAGNNSIKTIILTNVLLQVMFHVNT